MNFQNKSPAEKKKIIYSLAEAIQNVDSMEDENKIWDWILFNIEDWASKIICNHPRLFRSRDFGDPDYFSSILQVMEQIQKEEIPFGNSNIDKILEHESIKKWLQKNRKDVYDLTYRTKVTALVLAPINSTEGLSKTLQQIIKDIDILLKENGAISVVDRVHTLFHAYLKEKCNLYGIEYEEKADINKLYKAIKNSPVLFNCMEKNTFVSKMINSQSSIIDAFNTIRNNNSLAHPNKDLLEDDEAYLCLYTIQVLFNYLEKKFNRL